MRRERTMYLWDVVLAVECVETFTDGLSFEGFLAAPIVQAAVERKIEIIGEAIRQMEANFPGSSHTLPDVRLAIGMRNHLAHGYFYTDLQELWLTAKKDLDPIKQAARNDLARLQSSDRP